jgi:hypothetical protein
MLIIQFIIHGCLIQTSPSFRHFMLLNFCQLQVARRECCCLMVPSKQYPFISICLHLVESEGTRQLVCGRSGLLKYMCHEEVLTSVEAMVSPCFAPFAPVKTKKFNMLEQITFVNYHNKNHSLFFIMSTSFIHPTTCCFWQKLYLTFHDKQWWG